jgi:uncharacterized membrane protein YdfJ with MMPL/SSD domain
VLHYFAVSYLFVGLLETFAPALGPAPGSEHAETAETVASSGVGAALWRDIGRHAVQWVVMVAIGAVYLTVQRLLPVPGCPTGYIGAWRTRRRGECMKGHASPPLARRVQGPADWPTGAPTTD